MRLCCCDLGPNLRARLPVSPSPRRPLLVPAAAPFLRFLLFSCGLSGEAPALAPALPFLPTAPACPERGARPPAPLPPPARPPPACSPALPPPPARGFTYI